MATIVTLTCGNCGSKFDREYQHRDRKTCSKVCRYASMRVEKPILTDEQRAINDAERTRKIWESRRRNGTDKNHTTPECRAKISATLKRRYAAGEIAVAAYVRTEDHRAKTRATVLQAFKDGRLDATGCYKNKWSVYEGVNGIINMRSKTEVLFAQNLDRLSLRWEYEPKRFDLGWATYAPDFHVVDLDLWVECKGFWRDESLRKVREFAANHTVAVFMAQPILRQGSLPQSVAELFAGNIDINQVATQKPSSEEVTV